MLSWGSNSRGQRGWGGPEVAREAGQAELPNLCTQIAAGNEHSLALDVDGAVWAWGDNAHGELGSEGGVSGKPIRVPLGGGHALSIAAVRRGRGSNPRELPCPDETGVARRGEGEGAARAPHSRPHAPLCRAATFHSRWCGRAWRVRRRACGAGEAT